MNYRTTLFFILIISMIPSTDAMARGTLKKVSSFFGGKPYEAVVNKEYTMQQNGTLCLENITGNIQVKAEWKHNKVLLKATKKAAKEEHLEHINIVETHTKDKGLRIKTAYVDENVKGSVDYLLIIPAQTTLSLSTNTGEITIAQATGPITASTVDGTIEIEKANGMIIATTEKTGSIIIDQAHDNVKAITRHGNITLRETHKSVIAQADKGRINVNCKKVPAAGTISLLASSGNVNLSLPETTNATVQAKTERGTLTSDHYINVNPLMTRLDDGAWKKFKKEVDGTIGTGEATIKLSSNKGNIKILQTTA